MIPGTQLPTPITTREAKAICKPKAIGYVRVSTDRQADEGQGLDVQEAAIRRYCRQAGLRLDGLCQDVLSGTTSLDHRPGLGAVVDALRHGEPRVIVVRQLDRLARDLIEQEQIIREIRRLGGDVVTTAPGESHYLEDDPDDPSRKLIRQVLGSVSEYERAMISLRMRNGRAHKRARGGYADGPPPYGWRAEGGNLVADPFEQEVVQAIVAMRGRDRLSYREIAKRLNADGVSAKRGGRWHPATVSRIADNGARTAAQARSREYQRRLATPTG